MRWSLLPTWHVWMLAKEPVSERRSKNTATATFQPPGSLTCGMNVNILGRLIELSHSQDLHKTCPSTLTVRSRSLRFKLFRGCPCGMNLKILRRLVLELRHSQTWVSTPLQWAATTIPRRSFMANGVKSEWEWNEAIYKLQTRTQPSVSSMSKLSTKSPTSKRGL